MDEISFSSGDDRCAAWHFAATGEAFAGANGRPCVVMAPGFASTRDTGSLVAYAHGFAAAGLHTVLFDYRGFAASGGYLASACRPRASARTITRQSLDRRLPGVDPERIVLWGISFSGGHVIRVAAEDGRVAAVMSVTPAVDGVAVLAQLARNAGVRQLYRVAGHGLRDALRGLTGRRPYLVPVLGEPGSRAIIANTARSTPMPRSRARAGATRCARATRSEWRSTGRSGSPHAFSARCWCRPAPPTALPRRPAHV